MSRYTFYKASALSSARKDLLFPASLKSNRIVKTELEKGDAFPDCWPDDGFEFNSLNAHPLPLEWHLDGVQERHNKGRPFIGYTAFLFKRLWKDDIEAMMSKMKNKTDQK